MSENSGRTPAPHVTAREFEEFVAQVTAAVTGLDDEVDPGTGGVADPWFLDREKIVRRWPYPQDWLEEPPA